MTVVLWIAAGYNILWGAWAVLFPLAAFALVGMAPPNYPQFWQCIGMIVGVYGIGYGCAGRFRDQSGNLTAKILGCNAQGQEAEQEKQFCWF